MLLMYFLYFCLSQIGLSAVHGSQNNLSNRIVGGKEAYAGQFPFLAAIRYQTNQGLYFCGGTLISQEWVLTAGHCVENAILFSVTLGSYNLDKNDTNYMELSTDIYAVHPEYNSQTLENDIGLIKFRMAIGFTTYIAAVSLPNVPISATLLYQTMGWGQSSDSSATLQERVNWVYVTPVANEECRLVYGNQIKDNMVCAEGNFNEGTCYGDTGGPFVHHESRAETIVDGVSSFISQNGCESTDPSGYTRVFPYVSWIKNVTGIL